MLSTQTGRRSLAVLIALAFWAPRARAQAAYGSMAGTVTDAFGAAVPEARLTITSLERKTVDTVVSNASGFYLKDRLVPGAYAVTAGHAGFREVHVESAMVYLDTQTRVDLALDPGPVTETVTVEGQGQLLKTDRADVATTLSSQEVTDLPNLDRNFTRFVLLAPGTLQTPYQQAASENPQGSTQIMVNGQSFSGTGYQLDGTENRDPILGIIVINPNLEAIAESKITTQDYDAEFGQAIAGVVSVQTKSGTNELHGSAFEFYQGDRFQARNPFTQPEGQPLPDTEKHQFGASLGGPLRKDGAFFFADYQGLRSVVGNSRLLTVPTLRARTGDLGEYGIPIFDPAGGDPANRQPFPLGIIPGTRLSPQALAILRLIPEPNVPGVDGGTRDNYLAAGSEDFDSDAFDVRLDGRLNERLNVFGRYSLADFRRDGPTAFGAGGGPELVTLGGTSKARNQSLALGADLTLSPTTVLDFRFGFFRYKVDLRSRGFGVPAAQEAGIPGLNLDELSSGLPEGFIVGPGGFVFGFGPANSCNCPLVQDEKQFQLVGNLIRQLGSHTLKLGADVRRAYNLRVASDSPRHGALVFDVNRTRGPEGGGLGLASFLLGDVSFFQRNASQTSDARERQWRQFYYVQDTWRATPKLTVNYGLRLEVINPQTVNAPGNGGFLDLATGEIKVAGVGGIGLDGDVRNSLNWAPRLGIAYKLDEKTVIRAGYGRSYDIGVFGSTFGHTVTQNLPVLATQTLVPPTDFGSVFNLAEGPPPVVFPEIPANGRFPLPDGVSTNALPDKQRLPALDAYNLTVQRQLTRTLSAELAYVGNKGTHVFAGDFPTVDLNQATLEGYGQGPGTPGFVPRNERRPLYRQFGWTQDINYYCNCADNRYDSLQAKLTGRFSGTWLLASYTLQRIRQDGADQFFYDRELNYGPPDWSRVHSFSLAATVELPFGAGKRFFSGASSTTDRIIGGWQINTITTIQSGLPFDVVYPAGGDRDTGPNRPDLIGDPSGPRSRDQWFNATPIGSPGSAFGRPAVGTFGNLKRNALQGPGYWRVDASLVKELPLAAKLRAELRVDVVNLFNHVNLGLPDREIGTPTDPRPDAGRISSTANLGTDPQRNLQFAVRLTF
jgi:outer membrane receptor protein involved in Fe transport